ncbi:5-demethoxyubiquinol-8 5-hydroxylase UbiM [Brackiella oedipodis]|uniref:5-demethoxyubiquinol-8 5-hydroxylase UbiM n=1 Tax=Brackiella oedipodis TaxID=124225 RepID=UPI00048D6884|nr:5-demethoxyubiquinol-8 5-hydroxylase UbiM [Brackiella oedipodis]
MSISEQYDVVIIGAGPAGLSFARKIAPSGKKIAIIEKSSKEVLANPPYDGREIALTHLSKEIMQHLDMWSKIPEDEIYLLKEAKVLNGRSDYTLHFPQPHTARGKPADTLGYLISNHNIRRSAYEACQAFSNIHFVTGIGVESASNDGHLPIVKLQDGTEMTAQLLVAADSRFSNTRRQLGISCDMHDFGRTVMVFRTEHTKSNGLTATECFFYGSTLACLPLGQHMTNCVVTIDANRTHELLDLNREQLAAHMQSLLKNRLGDMKVLSDIHSYPLVGVHARSFCSHRSALIGDAAVGMHPVTAHGFNLGLESAHILGNLVLEAAAAGQDIGNSTLLQRYNLRHQAHTRIMYHGTNVVVKLFTNETSPARFLRKAVVRLSNNMAPVKFLISRQLTG